MKEIFLLGAGASIEAGIPDSYQMSEKIIENIAADPRLHNITKILNFVIGGIIFHNGLIGENPYSGVNVEDLFTTVELLAKRRTSELSPFISSWHPFLQEIQRGKLSYFSSKNLLEQIYSPIEKYFEDYSKGSKNQQNSYYHKHINPSYG